MLLALGFAAGYLSSSTPADAYVLNGCKFAGTSPAISYRRYSLTSSIETAFVGGQAAWDASSAPGYFYDTTSSTPNIPVYDAYYAGSWWAVASGGCDPGGFKTWYNDRVTIKFDQGDMASLAADEKEMVAIHELGHAYGLAHTNLTCSSPGPAVMRQGSAKFSCSGSAPWSNDVDGVHYIY